MEELNPNDDMFQNWVRCAKALNIASDPLLKFVEPVNRRLHQNMLQNIKTETNNTSCTFRNAEKCPSKICNKLKFHIVDAHRFNRPTFNNTELKHCWTDHWEMAKCYMSSGYRDVHTASETDFSGFISLVINHLYFQRELKVDLNDPKNIFIRARDVRNVIMHNSKLQVTAFNMFVYTDVIAKLLTDIMEGIRLHAIDRHARDVQVNDLKFAISQIKSIGFSRVTKEETHHVLLQANLAMRKMRRELKQTVETTKKECIDSIREVAAIERMDIEITTVICRQILETVGKELINKLLTQTEEGCSVISRKINEKVEEIDDRATQGIVCVENRIDNVAYDRRANQKDKNINFVIQKNEDNIQFDNLIKMTKEIKRESNIRRSIRLSTLDELSDVKTAFMDKPDSDAKHIVTDTKPLDKLNGLEDLSKWTEQVHRRLRDVRTRLLMEETNKNTRTFKEETDITCRSFTEAVKRDVEPSCGLMKLVDYRNSESVPRDEMLTFEFNDNSEVTQGKDWKPRHIKCVDQYPVECTQL